MSAVAGAHLTGCASFEIRPAAIERQSMPCPRTGEPWEDTVTTSFRRVRNFALGTALGTACLAFVGSAPALAEDIIVGLITKAEINPFFVKMKEGAQAKAKELGVELRSYAGKVDGDNEGQVAAIESLIAAGAKGILITPSDTKAIVPAVQRARDAGVLVIALDTQLEPSDAADATFATDNFRAGELIGEWAAAKLGDEAED